MKIVFFGNGNRAYNSLKYLIEKDVKIKCIVGLHFEEDKFFSIIQLAKKNKILYFLTDNPNDKSSIKFLNKLNADLFILGGYSKILKKEVIEIPKKFCINLHGGKLPNYRGSSPLNWALINNEREFTISIIKVEMGIDTGEILKEHKQTIETEDTILDLHRKANEQFPKLLLKVINEIEKDSYKLIKQDQKDVAYFPLRNKEDGFILFDQLSTKEVHSRIRALTRPYPCAFSFWKSQKVSFIKSELNNFPYYGEAGKIYRKTKKGLLVTCKDESIWILKAEFEDGSDAISAIQKYDSFTTIRGEILNSFKNKIDRI